MCQPRVQGTVGAEPFSAKIRYTGPDDPDFPNLIKLTVNMPHMDGELSVFNVLFSVIAIKSNTFEFNTFFSLYRHVASDLHKASLQL